MANNNITSANSTAVLVVESLYPAGIILENYATDQAIAQDELVLSQSRMGVDGKIVHGMTPKEKVLTITFEASAPCVESINNVALAMMNNKTIYNCTLIVTIPSISAVYTYTFGALTSGKVFPDVKGVLDPVSYKLTYQDMKKSVI